MLKLPIYVNENLILFSKNKHLDILFYIFKFK